MVNAPTERGSLTVIWSRREMLLLPLAVVDGGTPLSITVPTPDSN